MAGIDSGKHILGLGKLKAKLLGNLGNITSLFGIYCNLGGPILGLVHDNVKLFPVHIGGIAKYIGLVEDALDYHILGVVLPLYGLNIDYDIIAKAGTQKARSLGAYYYAILAVGPRKPFYAPFYKRKL